MGSKETNYGLYQTLSQNIPKKDLRTAQKVAIREKISTLPQREKEAAVMLILEHARLNDDFKYDPSNVILPYGGSFDKKSVTFDVGELPISLRWILMKFLDVVEKQG